MTAKQQILVALTYRKLPDSPSEISDILGFKSQQIHRDLNDLIDEGLVEKDGKGSLRLTKKAREEPLVALFIDNRRIGAVLLLGGIITSIILLFGIIYGVSTNLYLIYSQFTIIALLITIGAYLCYSPKLLSGTVPDRIINK
ncbi:MAG: hypothetical protein ABC611_08125 [Candidatus Methanosuratincola petrocarbonis]